MSNDGEEQVNSLEAARQAVEEAQLRVKTLTEDVAEAMAVNNNKQAGACHRERLKAVRELERLKEALRALEEGQSKEA